MIDMYRIRYEGRGDNENVIGVMTHFADSPEVAMARVRRWIDMVYGVDSEFDLFNDGATFQFGG